MNAFDYQILSFLTRYANRAPLFDNLVAVIAHSTVIKGALPAMILWWAWFQPDRARDERRRTVLVTLAAAFAGLTAARGLAAILPYRPRPLVLMQAAGDAPAAGWQEWSSFPSDHATLFVALALGIWRISRALGAAMMVHAAVIVCVPRVFLGLHYPTDILAGAALGAGLVWAFARPGLRAALSDRPLRWCERRPGVFYAVFFFVTYQIATLFDDVRRLGESLWKIYRLP